MGRRRRAHRRNAGRPLLDELHPELDHGAGDRPPTDAAAAEHRPGDDLLAGDPDHVRRSRAHRVLRALRLPRHPRGDRDGVDRARQHRRAGRAGTSASARSSSPIPLLRVAAFLGAFSAMYFTVLLSTDATYREEFADDVAPQLRQALAVRCVYRIGPIAGAHMSESEVDIRAVDDPAEMQRMVTLFNQVWGTTTPLVGTELLRAVQHAGGYVAAAYLGDQVVGASLGFLGRHLDQPSLHSHVTGVLPGVRRTGLGRAMKLHQQAWAADHGLAWVTWTFDPLVRRNAWFNIARPRRRGARVPRRLLRPDRRLDQRRRRERPAPRRLAGRRLRPRTKCRAALAPLPCRHPTTSSCCGAPIRTPRRHGATGCVPSWADRSPPAGGCTASPGTATTSWCTMHDRPRIGELREIRLPLVTPFRTSFGVQTSRRILLVRAEVDARRHGHRRMGRVRRRRRADVLVGVRRRRGARHP